MLINYERLKKYRYRKSPNTNHYCYRCAGQLDFCLVEKNRLEKNLYCVRCEDCGTHTLIEASNGEMALRKVGENG